MAFIFDNLCWTCCPWVGAPLISYNFLCQVLKGLKKCQALSNPGGYVMMVSFVNYRWIFELVAMIILSTYTISISFCILTIHKLQSPWLKPSGTMFPAARAYGIKGVWRGALNSNVMIGSALNVLPCGWTNLALPPALQWMRHECRWTSSISWYTSHQTRSLHSTKSLVGLNSNVLHKLAIFPSQYSSLFHLPPGIITSAKVVCVTSN